MIHEVSFEMPIPAAQHSTTYETARCKTSHGAPETMSPNGFVQKLPLPTQKTIQNLHPCRLLRVGPGLGHLCARSRALRGAVLGLYDLRCADLW